MSLSALIRYGVYPVVMTSTVGAVGLVLYGVLPTWPALAVIATLGIAAVALLERLQPYERDWLRDHGDLRADVLHAIFNLGLLAGTAYALHALRGVLPVCLFTGSDREVPDARRIYGQAMERLPAIGWLADAVTRLIRGQLRRG